MGRAIVVGDVHGCRSELERLLDKLRWRADDDRLYFVGDLASRGPDPLGVLSWVRRTGGKAVLGNNENALLHWRVSRKKNGRAPALGRSQRDFVDRLSDADWALLESLPLYLDLPEHNLRIVHAGVLPDVPFTAQPREVLLSIRYVSRSGEPLDTREPDSGAVLWGQRYHGPMHIVFGHYARPGVQIHPYATGIDTGAVYGNRLTALVLGPDQQVPPPEGRDEVLAWVASEKQYYVPRSR
jgi:hypothetical protein